MNPTDLVDRDSLRDDSPISPPATPSRCTCGWWRAPASGCRSSRAR